MWSDLNDRVYPRKCRADGARDGLLRYLEQELASVPAERQYAEPNRPLVREDPHFPQPTPLRREKEPHSRTLAAHRPTPATHRVRLVRCSSPRFGNPVRAPDVSSPVPDNCPECECELYPSRHTYPRPVRTFAGRIVLAAGFLLSGLVFLGAIAALVLLLMMPAVVAGLVAFVPAFGVGLAGAVLSERLGRVLKVSCRKCPWATNYAAGHRPYGQRVTDSEPS